MTEVARLRLIDVSGAHDHGSAGGCLPRDEAPQLRPAHGIDSGSGLVENQETGTVQERHGDRQLPSHTT